MPSKRKMAKPNPGAVWLVDLGMAAKVRPCLVLRDYPAANELALIVIVPHTTALHQTRWEFVLSKPFLKPGAFHLQQVQPISIPRFERRLGMLAADEFWRLKTRLVQVLRLLLEKHEG